MKDYLQPDFYRFNEDSLKLVKEVLNSGIRPDSLLDMGAGSGVIGLELAKVLRPGRLDFLELQTEWEPYLSGNIRDFLPKDVQTNVFWNSFSSWVPDRQYELIVCNPPYYLPGRGILSPDPVRARCRSFEVDDWESLLSKCLSALTPDGMAWFVSPKENQELIEKLRSGKNDRLQFVWI